jgi:drug/metabolite transporter (DMT)-like permease
MNLNKTLWQWIWLIALAFIWGSSFILIKKGLNSYEPEQVAAYRMLFAAVLLSPVAFKHLKQINKKTFWPLLEVAFIGNAIPAYLFAVGQTHINSSLAGILNSITPIATLIVGLLFFGVKTRWANIIGLIMGLIGAVGLILSSNTGVEGDLFYSLLVVIAGIMYATNLNVIKYMLKDMSGLVITSIAFLFTLPAAALYLLFAGYEPTHGHETANLALLYIFLLALFSSAIAVVGFNIMVKYTSAIFASSVTYIIPIFAIMWGLFDGEQVFISQIIWLAVIILGIYLVNKKEKS